MSKTFIWVRFVIFTGVVAAGVWWRADSEAEWFTVGILACLGISMIVRDEMRSERKLKQGDDENS